MRKKIFLVFLISMSGAFFNACSAGKPVIIADDAQAQACSVDKAPAGNAVNNENVVSFKPEEALNYMKSTDNIFIVDVRSNASYNAKHFNGAVNIPYAEVESRCDEIPADVPVLINCNMGSTAPLAYKMLKEKRPDIKEMHYIAGVPLFDEYNSK